MCYNGRCEGRPAQLYSAAPCWTLLHSHSYGQSTVHMQLLYSLQITLLKQQKQRYGLYLEGGSRVKQGNEAAKTKGSRKYREYLEGKAPPQAPSLLLPPMYLMVWWHPKSLLTSCDGVSACTTTCLCALVLGERQTGK